MVYKMPRAGTNGLIRRPCRKFFLYRNSKSRLDFSKHQLFVSLTPFHHRLRQVELNRSASTTLFQQLSLNSYFSAGRLIANKYKNLLERNIRCSVTVLVKFSRKFSRKWAEKILYHIIGPYNMDHIVDHIVVLLNRYR